VTRVEKKLWASGWETTLGADPQYPGNKYESFFNGTMERVRISRVARYAADYDPPAAYEADADTVALYKFREGEGKLLRDSSGHKADGRIDGPTWVPVQP
jgi:hypothetical protein